jgi:hypothetical protein
VPRPNKSLQLAHENLSSPKSNHEAPKWPKQSLQLTAATMGGLAFFGRRVTIEWTIR